MKVMTMIDEFNISHKVGWIHIALKNSNELN